MVRMVAAGCLLPALLFTSWAVAQVVPDCGSLENAFGPFDYRDPAARGQPLHMVESVHFTHEVAALTHGSTGALIQDLDYTLRAFPNHYPALQSLERYALEGGKFLDGKPAECYFKRAVAFRPADPGTHVSYGNYLLACTRLTSATVRGALQCADYKDASYMDARVLKAARDQYEEALRIAPDSPDVSYSAALFYLDVNELDTAKRLAEIAYRAGYPLMGLKKRLEAAEASKHAKAPSTSSAP